MARRKSVAMAAMGMGVVVLGGIIYMVVPDRRHTWDHARPLTPPEHMWEDYIAGTSQVDGTHINDFIDDFTGDS